MPTYEYECQKCGHRFEAFQRITEEPLRHCPQKGCRGSVKRLIGGGGGLLFKGSGFYITDYRSDSYKKAAKSEAKGGGDGASAKGEGAAKSDSPSTSATSSAKE